MCEYRNEKKSDLTMFLNMLEMLSNNERIGQCLMFYISYHFTRRQEL